MKHKSIIEAKNFFIIVMIIRINLVLQCCLMISSITKNCIDLIFTRHSLNVLIISFFSDKNILENPHAASECSKCQIQLSSIPWKPKLDSESIYCTIHLTSSTPNTNNIYERVTDSKRLS